MDSDTYGLYIHIPFCQKKCDYCDFISFDDKTYEIEKYTNTLIDEIMNLKEKPFDTIYLGGGTPSILQEKYLQDILRAVQEVHQSEEFYTEFTCEANPGTLSQTKIDILLQRGVNRFSIGLQAIQPYILKKIGRDMKPESFLSSYRILREYNVKNINVDIMFGLPEQTMEDIDETIKLVCDLSPEHISAYALTPGVTDDETDRRMYYRIREYLSKNGYDQYEISNFCKPGFESRHNCRYWIRKSYIGVWLRAHSYIRISQDDINKGNFGIRYSNTEDLSEYILYQRREEEIILTEEDAMAEFMFLGLRLTKGVSIEEFINEFGKSPLDIYNKWITKMTDDGLLYIKNGRIVLTAYGIDLSNTVMAGFL